MLIDFSDPALFNDVYIPYLTSNYPVEIYYGGSGSGKSEHVAQKQIIKCLKSKYYRLIFSRKTAEAIRDSQFRLFKDILSRWEISHLFTIKESTMDIICNLNGNMMLSHGLDKAEKIKSIAEPTDVWLEEATEFTEEDYDQLTLRLRTTKAELQMILSFNPIDENHWIKKRFFDTESKDVFTLHTTFEHNKFLSDTYRQKLENLATVNANFHRIYMLGEWGKAEVKRPFLYNFDSSRHVGSATIIHNLPLLFSWDFNVEPLVCIVGQKWKDRNGNEMAHIFKEFVQKDGDIDALLDTIAGNKLKGIKGYFTPAQLANAIYTGDANGFSRRVGGERPFKIIIKRLGIPDKRMKVPSVNPSIESSRWLCNAVLAHHHNFIIDKDCRLLINECQYTEATPEGQIIKNNRKDTAQRADALDCLRYWMSIWLPHYV